MARASSPFEETFRLTNILQLRHGFVAAGGYNEIVRSAMVRENPRTEPGVRRAACGGVAGAGTLEVGGLIGLQPAVRYSGVMLNFITHRDHRLMRRVNRWPAPRWVRLWMLAASRAGDGWLWYSIGVAVLLFGGAVRFHAIFAAALAAGASILLFLRLKRTANRKRPCEYEPHCWADLLPPDQFSFPSGHTMTAFSVAIAFARFYPSLLASLLFCAASIGASRIVLGMHFLSDVVVGGLIGTGMAYVAVWTVRALFG